MEESMLICLICRESSPEFLTRCNHNFHKPCLDLWLQKISECPYCRGFVTNNLQDERSHFKIEKLKELNDENLSELEKDNFILQLNEIFKYIDIVSILQEFIGEDEDSNSINSLIEKKFIIGKLSAQNSACNTTEILNLFQKACFYGNLDIIRLLVKNGADVNASDNDGCNPLILAFEYGHLEIVKLLIKNGADINATDNNGYNPLIYAFEYGHLEIVKFFIENCVDVNANDNDGCNPLILPFKNGYLEIVKLFIENGTDINATYNYGYTSLILESLNGNLEKVKFFIENGANVNITNKNGNTPLHYASENNHFKIVKLLIENGANFNVTNKNGNTCY